MYSFRDTIVFTFIATCIPANRDGSPAPTLEAFEPRLIERSEPGET